MSKEIKRMKPQDLERLCGFEGAIKSTMSLITRRDIEENLKFLFPKIKDVLIFENVPEKFSVYVIVILPPWYWLGLGIVHYLYRKKIERAFRQFGAAAIKYDIRVI